MRLCRHGDGDWPAGPGGDHSRPGRRAAPGLVAAYSFDEGSGGVAVDASGNGHTGTISGASGRGDATAAGSPSTAPAPTSVSAASAPSTSSAFTLEAWVQKQTATKNDVAVVGTWAGSGPMLWVDHLATRYHLTLGSSLSSYLDSGATRSPANGSTSPPPTTAPRPATTSTGPRSPIVPCPGASATPNIWRIGAYGSTPIGFFDGIIDDVRIYDRALTAGDVQLRHEPTGATADPTPPTAPGTLTATAEWVRRPSPGARRPTTSRSPDTTSTGPRPRTSRPRAANRIAQPTGTSYTDGGLAAGTYYYKVTAEDAAGNVGAASNEASVVVIADIDQADGVDHGSGLRGDGAVDGHDQRKCIRQRRGGRCAISRSTERTSEPRTRPRRIRSVGLARTGERVSWADCGRPRHEREHHGPQRTVTVTVSNSGVSSAGLKAAYGLDRTSGTVALRLV